MRVTDEILTAIEEKCRTASPGSWRVLGLMLVGLTGGGCGPEVPSEVGENLQRLFSSAESYYQAEHPPAGGGEPVTEHFPAPSAGPTPLLGDCCTQGGTCPPEDAQWTDPTWAALEFSITDPSPFSYEYEVNDSPGAKDGSNRFTATAWGDLDCDGLYSTFVLTGVAGESGVTASEIVAHHPDE